MVTKDLSHFNRSQKLLGLSLSAITSAIIFWLIVSKSFSFGLSRDYPEVASYINPTISSITLDGAGKLVTDIQLNKQAPIIANQHTVDIKEQVNPEQLQNAPQASINSFSREKKALISLIQREPTSATAFRLLGQIADQDNQAKLAGSMMFQSTQLSLHDPVALYSMLSRSMNAHNYAYALYYANAFLRGYPSNFTLIAPMMMQMITSDQARPLLVSALAGNPPWRQIVLNSSYSNAGLTDIQAPLKLLVALNETASPPQLKELVGYLNYLFQNQQFELAYSTWLLFIPVELMDQTGLIFNGSFETDPTGLLFDWTIGKGSEVEVGITDHPDNESSRALFVEFGIGRTKFPLVRQTILLTPGNYQLSYQVKGEIMARRGLEWQIICENGKQADEGKTVIGRFQNWRRINLDVTIPKEGCRYQYLRLVHLARSASEQMAHGQLWFDDLSIQRLNDAPPLNP